MTNFDKIKGLDIDKLANFIEDVTICDSCPAASRCENEWFDCDCMEAIKKWLNEKAEEEEDLDTVKKFTDYVMSIGYYTCKKCGTSYNRYDDDGDPIVFHYCPHCGRYIKNFIEL